MPLLADSSSPCKSIHLTPLSSFLIKNVKDVAQAIEDIILINPKLPLSSRANIHFANHQLTNVTKNLVPHAPEMVIVALTLLKIAPLMFCMAINQVAMELFTKTL